MIRIASTLCFLLTLFCPIFCLAEVDGECSDHGQTQSRNCEAMSVGAVVVESETVATPSLELPALDLLFPTHPLLSVSHGWLQLAAWNRANIKSPPAATRQALLQTFLF